MVRFRLGEITVNGMTALTNILALLLLWSRGKSVLDLWLMVAVCALIMEAVMISIVYSGSLQPLAFMQIVLIFLVVSKVVLIVLLSETLILHGRLASALILQRRERDNRLMSVNAATAAIAHEIKQPLTVIWAGGSAALRWLKRTPPDREEAIACLTAMMESSGRADEIVE